MNCYSIVASVFAARLADDPVTAIIKSKGE